MAGVLTRGVTIAANESLGTLGAKLSQLIDLSTFSGFSDSESGNTIVITQVQATPPTSVSYDFWVDTTSKTLRVYDGGSGQERWDAIGNGMALANGMTAQTNIPGDVVGFAGNLDKALSFGVNNLNPIAGVLAQTTPSAAFGLVMSRGLVTCRVVSGTTRGWYVHQGAAGFVAGATTGYTGTFGVLLSTATGGTSTVLLRGYNG